MYEEAFDSGYFCQINIPKGDINLQFFIFFVEVKP
jgi:hypothetical protein